MKGRERKGKERKGKERKGKERKGKERKGKESHNDFGGRTSRAWTSGFRVFTF